MSLMRKRDAIRKMIRDVIDNDAEYTIYWHDEPVTVIIPVEKVAYLQEQLSCRE